MTRRTAVTLALLLALVAVFAVSFVVGGLHTDPVVRFGGSDTAATSQIQATSPGYQPWFTPLFRPQSAEVESGLFALQAAIGGVVLGFAIGAYWGRRRAEKAVPALGGMPDAADAPDQAV